MSFVVFMFGEEWSAGGVGVRTRQYFCLSSSFRNREPSFFLLAFFSFLPSSWGGRRPAAAPRGASFRSFTAAAAWRDPEGRLRADLEEQCAARAPLRTRARDRDKKTLRDTFLSLSFCSRGEKKEWPVSNGAPPRPRWHASRPPRPALRRQAAGPHHNRGVARVIGEV